MKPNQSIVDINVLSLKASIKLDNKTDPSRLAMFPSGDKQKMMQSIQTRNPQNVGDKRMSLRDYLFIANASCERNRDRKISLIRSTPKQQQRKTSISKLRTQKYDMPKVQLYSLIKTDVLKGIKEVFQELQLKKKLLEQQNISVPEHGDMMYLYQLRRVINLKIKPALKEVDSIYFKSKYETTLKHIVQMASSGQIAPVDSERQPKAQTDKVAVSVGTQNSKVFNSPEAKIAPSKIPRPLIREVVEQAIDIGNHKKLAIKRTQTKFGRT